jgi:flagellar hook assembly protein FlgD
MKDEAIFKLSVKIDDAGDTDWKVGDESVFADANGKIFPNAVISMPKLVNVTQNGLSSWNQPNPFKEQTNITYTLPVSGNVTVTIYNSLGQEVLVPVNSKQDAGTYSFILDGKTLPVGAYVYKLTLETPAEKFSAANRMLLTR